MHYSKLRQRNGA